MGAPVRSMTGVGQAVLEHAVGRFEVEARSVNHRFLKVSLRTQGGLPDLAQEVEERVRTQVARGHVTLNLRLTPTPAAGAGSLLDAARFASAAEELARLAKGSGLPGPTVGDVLRLPGVLAEAGGVRDAGLASAALEAVDAVLAALEQTRRREGAALVAELLRLLEAIERASSTLAVRAAAVPSAWQTRLKGRLDDLLKGSGVAVDPTSLAREVAALADRSDVREELTRLAAHVAHAREILAAGGAVGRPLDFLAQELAREANTVGSKANDLELTRSVIGLKADVERLREQVQNLE
jgi:uncharacterized protein (TIGR00255 family)